MKVVSGTRTHPFQFRYGGWRRRLREELPPIDDDVDDWALEAMCLNDLAARLEDGSAGARAELHYVHAPFFMEAVGVRKSGKQYDPERWAQIQEATDRFVRLTSIAPEEPHHNSKVAKITAPYMEAIKHGGNLKVTMIANGEETIVMVRNVETGAVLGWSIQK